MIQAINAHRSRRDVVLILKSYVHLFLVLYLGKLALWLNPQQKQVLPFRH